MFSWLLLQQAPAQVSVTNLRCEMLNNPLGIDAAEPGLSWQINTSLRNVQQTAYQVLVASSKEKLARNEGDYWSSGKIQSSQSIHVPYAGRALISRMSCYWKVKVFTSKGESSWSEPAFWSMGFLQQNDWKGKWIGYDNASPWDSISQWSRLSARYLRKEFQLSSRVQQATLYIVGLGLYEVFLNGQKVGDHVLTPAPTDYRKSVLYNVYDVTRNVQQGGNAIATILGNGRFFTMRQNYKTNKHNTFGYPKLLLQLEVEYTNGTKKIIVSDESWKLQVDGPIRTNNEYDGEEHDAAKEPQGWTKYGFYDKTWMKPQLVSAPAGRIVAQQTPAMKVMRSIAPVSINQISPGKYILDMGQNFSGWVKMKFRSQRNHRLPVTLGETRQPVKLRYAESLQPNGELYVANLRDARVTDLYNLSGEREEQWHPTFVYHGFRYVEITGYPGTPTIQDFEGQLIYDNLATTGTFHCSDSTINTIYKNAWWGIASNYKGMPVDCPQRNERQPWLGDRTIGASGEAYLFNNATLYAKWLDDIQQSQTPEGAIPDVAPAFWNYYSDNVTWPAAYITVANMLYRQFGDAKPVIKHYPSMKHWMEYMRGKYMKDFLITKDKYGDWCVPPESLELIRSKDSTRTTKGELIATAYYYQLLQYMKQFAKLSGHSSDTILYDSLSEKIQLAFQQKFFNNQMNWYDNNTVTANLLPLYFGIAPDSVCEAVFNNIYNKIKRSDRMHISTGLIGTQWLMRGLTRFHRSDIAYTLASNKTYPSWGYMAANGATTIWELWNGNTANPQMNSQNHVMLLGDLLIWLYENIAGISPDDTAPGFKKIIMKPELVDGLKHANASYQSAYGLITSKWRYNRIGSFSWEITIPANTTATVYIPADAPENISVDGKHPLLQHPDIRFIKMEDKYAVVALGSGRYSFHSTFNFKKGIVTDEFIFQRAAFPESHAATIAETPEGLIAAWFGGTKEGYKDVCIWTSRLVNGQWTAPEKVADGVLNDSTRHPCYNPVLFQVPNGELLLFYKIGPNVAGWTGWMMRSSNNGHTWSKREALPAGFLGPIKNKPVLINGKLICGSSTEKNGWKVHFEITPDFGKTWYKTDSINDGKIVSAIQPSILTYADGRWQVLCRSRNRTINESWSTDSGKTWSPMTASSLPNNNSGTDAVTLKDGRQLLVYNHVKPAPELPNGKGPRTPLNVAVSKDGKNWEAALILEDSPVSQYSYPSVIQTKDGMVHVVYTWRRERIKYVKIDPLQLELKPIVHSQWPGVQNRVTKPSDD